MGGGSGSGGYRDGKSSVAGLDVRATRAKYLGTGAAGGTAAGGGAGDNAARAGKTKAKWTWEAGKSLFGKKSVVVDGGKKSVSEHERVEQTHYGTAPAFADAGGSNSKSVAAVAVTKPTLVGSGTSGGAPPGDNREKGGGAGGNNSVIVSRIRDNLETTYRKPSDGSRSIDSRTSTTDSRRQGGRQQPGGEKERGRWSRSTADQRPSGVDREGGGGAAGAARVRDSRRPRQSRSVDSPVRLQKEASDAAAAAEAAHGFFSVPAASYADSSNSRDSSGKQRQREGGGTGLGHLSELSAPGRVRSASTENEESAVRDGSRDRSSRVSSDERKSVSSTSHASSYTRVMEQRLQGGSAFRGDDVEFRRLRRPRVVEVGTRGERVSSGRPSSRSTTIGSGGYTRARSQDRIESGRRSRLDAADLFQGQQWSDLTSSNYRPPPSYRNPSSDITTPSTSGGAKASSGRPLRSGRIMAASPANSSNTTSDENCGGPRLGTDESTPSTVDWGTSSLAGWGESMAAEAEAEVLGRSRDTKQGGGRGRGGEP